MMFKNISTKLLLLFGMSLSVTNVNAGAEEVTPTFVGCHPNGVCYIGISPLAVSTICPNKGRIL